MNKTQLLQDWAKKVINLVTPYAQQNKYNKTFYPLQSPIAENPDVLILGLNPKGNFNYSDQAYNPIWEFENGIMTVERLLNGNPTYVEEHENWKIIKGLRKIHVLDRAIKEEKYVYANYFYLNTDTFDEVYEQEDALDICKELTYDLINILSPRLIVILGTADGFDKLNDFDGKKLILRGKRQRLLISAYYKGIPVIAIPHTSRMILSVEELQAINTNILEIYEGNTLTKFENCFDQDFSKDQFDYSLFEQKLNNSLPPAILSFNRINGKGLYEGFLKGKIDTIRIVIDTKHKYIAIRDCNIIDSKSKDRFFANLLGAEKYLKCFQLPYKMKVEGHLLKKTFGQYASSSLKELYQAIADDLMSLSNNIS